MSDQTPSTIKVDSLTILNLSCDIIRRMFIQSSEVDAKKLLKELKHGKSIKLGSLTLSPPPQADEPEQPSIKLGFRLTLDYSEFVGPFSFPAFHDAVHSMLLHVARVIREKKPLSILANDDGSAFVYHHPGMINNAGQWNVLVPSVDLSLPKEIQFKLMFVDPSQYKTREASEA